MPVYDYLCADCGPFTDMRTMAEHELPNDCPTCGLPAPRVMLTAPRLGSKSSGKFSAAALASGSHASGCGCCTTGMSYKKKTLSNSAKNFSS